MAHENLNQLINALVSFVDNQLKKHGVFYPDAAIINNEGKVVMIGIDDPKENPQSLDLVKEYEYVIKDLIVQ
jgi:hypothetical protein